MAACVRGCGSTRTGKSPTGLRLANSKANTAKNPIKINPAIHNRFDWNGLNNVPLGMEQKGSLMLFCFWQRNWIGDAFQRIVAQSTID